ncbi:MAG: response regulator transcription factor [Gammaproteobacteria bacterium]|nr:response regulator transcription factor [Gammaproteobacteria bacterium]NNJ49826.1 response regulator transcription factor [Gammaproteobacteria bacterium]
MNPGEAKSVLLIEDHADIAEMVGAYLENRDYIVDYAADGITGLHLAVSNEYDAIILDLMLPGMDGLEVCQKIRDDAKSDVPIIMLTARDTLDDKISGLDKGADDYLIKPFAIQELEARVRSLIRRYSGDIKKEIITVGDLSIDTSTLKVQRGDKDLAITPIGLKILSVLMRASPAVVSRRELERQVWGDILPDSDTLRSHLYNLRKIVDKPFEKKILVTVQGNGFKIIDSNESA